MRRGVIDWIPERVFSRLPWRAQVVLGRCAQRRRWRRHIASEDVGQTWRWRTWREYPVIEYDVESGEETVVPCTHENCMVCFYTRFAERYADDLSEGWTRTDEDGDDWWVCPDCFDLLREQYEWAAEGERSARPATG